MKYRIGLFIILIALLVGSVGPMSVTAQDDMIYQEAPMLAEMVAAGELPPVEERLPDDPMVVEPLEMGVYGGDWNRVMRPNDAGAFRRINYTHLVRWNYDWTEVVPDVAESFEVNADSTEFTFTLREGHKWSDGMPFTAYDIEFWYEGLATNEELSPGGSGLIKAGGELAEFELIDEQTFKFIFPVPAGMFLRRLAEVNGGWIVRYPKHYFSQFHPDYNDNIDELIAEAGVESWVELIDLKGRRYWDQSNYHPDIPTLDPWVAVTAVEPNSTTFIMERNPYFFKVDPEGRQYPYFDRVVNLIIEDGEAQVLAAASGQIDLQARHLNNDANKPFLFDNQDEGNYTLIPLRNVGSNTVTLHLNQTHSDPARRDLYQNKDFRIALSHAIDRQEIIDTVFISQGIPQQPAPLPGTQFYHEQLATQYIDYDPDLANQMLDDLGFTERNSDGIRLGPDGEPISFTLIYDNSRQTYMADVAEFLARYFEAVGVQALPREAPGDSFGELVYNNNYEAALGPSGAGVDILSDMRDYFPFSTESWWGYNWNRWYAGELNVGEEPTDERIMRQFDLWTQITATASQEEQAALATEILDIAADYFPVIGISTPADTFMVVKNDIHNMPSGMVMDWPYPTPGPANPFTFFRAE